MESEADAAATTQAAWIVQARADAIAEFGALTASQLADIRAVAMSDAEAIVDGWVDEGRVFAVDGPGGRLIPAFQIARGEPQPVIARVLSALSGALRGWEIALWFTGSGGHLEGARPVDRLADAPDEVVAAAAYQASLSTD